MAETEPQAQEKVDGLREVPGVRFFGGPWNLKTLGDCEEGERILTDKKGEKHVYKRIKLHIENMFFFVFFVYDGKLGDRVIE